MEELFSLLPWLIIVGAFGLVIARMARRAKSLDVRLSRLSVTFLKLEVDLQAIQDSVWLLSQHDEATAKQIEKIVARRRKHLAALIEHGETSALLLRGIEFPSMEDDKAFWADDRMVKLGLTDAENERSQT